MPDRFSIDDVRRLARLARLDPSPQALDDAARRLSAFVEYVDRLQSLDLRGVEPLTHPGDEAAATLRSDEPGPSLVPGVLASLAPAMDGPYLAVPKVIDRPQGGGA